MRYTCRKVTAFVIVGFTLSTCFSCGDSSDGIESSESAIEDIPYIKIKDLQDSVTYLKRHVHVDVNDESGRNTLWCELKNNEKYRLYHHPSLLIDFTAGNHYLVNIVDFNQNWSDGGCTFSRGLVFVGHVQEVSGDPTDPRKLPGPSFRVGENATWLKRSLDTKIDPNTRKPDEYCMLTPNTVYRTYHSPELEENHYKVNIVYFNFLGCGFSQGWVYKDHIELLDEATEKPITSVGSRTRAMLDVIGCAEGTGDAYNVIFSGVTFDNGYRWHPNRVICSYGLCSSATGRYQFLYTTWKLVASVLKLPDFSPPNQDRGGIYLLASSRGVYPENIKTYSQFRNAAYKLCWEWASFPGNCYGQSRTTASGLWHVFQTAFKGGNVGATCSKYVGGLSKGGFWGH